MNQYQKLRRSSGLPRGFTLVELLIAAAILLILTTMTVAVFTTTSSADRIRSSARQVQSAVGGARDRGFKAARDTPNARRGIRLLVDATDPTTVTSFVFIGSEDTWSQGQILIGRPDNTYSTTPAAQPDGHPNAPGEDVINTIRGYDTGWVNLFNQGLLTNGARIRIPATSPSSFTVRTDLLGSYNGGAEILRLTSAFATSPTLQAMPTYVVYGADGKPGVVGVDDDGNGSTDDDWEIGWFGSDDNTEDHRDITCLSGTTYALQLNAAVLPNQEPLRLSGGIAIDLYNSRIPSGWYQQISLAKGSPLPPIDQGYDAGSGTFYYNYWGTWSVEGTDPNIPANDIYRQYSPRMDIMFSPQGTVTGPLAAQPVIHLRLAEIEDITQARDPADPQAAPMLYCSLFPQTGYLGTFQVNITDANNDGYADDPTYFARIGGTAGR